MEDLVISPMAFSRLGKSKQQKGTAPYCKKCKDLQNKSQIGMTRLPEAVLA
jgi:hypothetical protein